MSLAPGSMLVSLAPNLLHGTCILHKKVVLGLMGPEGGAYAPQKGSQRLSACGVSAGTGRGRPGHGSRCSRGELVKARSMEHQGSGASGRCPRSCRELKM